MRPFSFASVKTRPRIVVVGPGPAQVGGLATFISILLAAPRLRESYELIHLDTTRGARGAGLASRLAPINFVYFARQARQLLAIVFRYKPRLMHVPLTSFWAYWKDAAFILLAHLLGMKVVAHLHGGVFDRYYRQSPRPVQWLIGRVMRRAEVVIALSDRWKQFLLEEVSPDINVQVIPNTVDAMFAGAIDEASGRVERREEMVLFVGALGSRKGVFDILKAAPLVLRQRPRTKFIFAGKEEEQGAQVQIEQICAEEKLNSAIQLVGQVTGQAKLALFLRASVFVLPSYGENLPYALLEAMSAGLPVVATPVGAVPEIVAEGQNGFLIQPGDYQALARRIVQLLEDASLQAQMSHANIARIQREYLPEVAIERFDGVYRKLLSES